MRILHLSDTHLYGDPDARHYDRIDTTAALRGLLARLAHLGPVDAVVHTGDASEDATAASYRLLHEILEPFAAAKGAVLAVALGNHDLSAVYAETIGRGDRGTASQDRVHQLPGGGRVVVLDSSVPGAGHGQLDADQLAWLREVLADPAPAGTVLAVHHPPLPAATNLLRGLELEGREQLGEVLTGTDVRLVLSGHYHHAMHGTIAGIPVHVAPGITNVVDPVGAAEREITLALSGASLIELAEIPGPGAGAGASAPDRGRADDLKITTSVYPNAGDTQHDPAAPVYDLGPEQVAAILEAARR